MSIIKKLFLAVVMTAIIGTSAYALENINQYSTLTSGIDDPQISYTGIEEPIGYENYWNCASRKLGRGVSNAAFGAFEVLIRIFSVNFEEGGFAGLTYGTLNGVGYFVLRELVGVFEIVTFPCPMPFTPNDSSNGYGWGYGPIVNPEWVVTPATDPWNLVYPNSAFRK